MTSLFETHREAFNAIAVHRPLIAEMAKSFSDMSEMESALGFGPSVVSKWVRKRSGISIEAERRAKNWLSKVKTPQTPNSNTQPDNLFFLVAAPAETVEKVRRVLFLLGCEVIE